MECRAQLAQRTTLNTENLWSGGINTLIAEPCGAPIAMSLWLSLHRLIQLSMSPPRIP